MSKKNDVAIVIIVFNIYNLISKQIELINKFCKENVDIIIIDNSSNLDVALEINKITCNFSCQYLKIDAKLDSSLSHAFACNYAYKMFNKLYKHILFMDHDIFPIQNFSIENLLDNKYASGIGQLRPNKIYFWPGLFIIDNIKIDTNIIDFSTNSSFGLDTGGNLYKLIETYGKENFNFLDEVHIQNNFNEQTQYKIYSLIGNTFMHFLNASNWANQPNNENRINFLLNILHNYVNDK